MELTRDNLKVFGFTDSEAQVLFVLDEVGPVTVSSLSRKGDIPRTTVYSALLRLKDRGFVRRVTKGQKKWKVVRRSKLKRLVQENLNHFDSNTDTAKKEEIVGGIDAEEIGIMVYRGKRQIQRAYESMLDLSRTERVFAIQGNKSAELALKKLEKQYLFDFHKKFKRAHIIMEGINGKFALSLFRELDVPTLKSHLNRMLVMAVLPDRYMDFNLDVLVFRETVVFINLDEEIVIFVRNKALVEMFNNFSRYFQDTGDKINLNRHIWEIIEEKKKA
ncbi:MarR family transcriptional regulator [Patescibacteria group bacterium]|nr:MarR family transcriptional regulator [Patescibacteria group bacterium]